jgi:hypothetical protein
MALRLLGHAACRAAGPLDGHVCPRGDWHTVRRVHYLDLVGDRVERADGGMTSDRYYRVGPAIWLEHWADDERLAAFYLLTSPHRSTEGLYRLPLSYAAEDMGWTVKRFSKALDRLISDGFVSYDASAQVVFIHQALKWQAPQNPNQIKAAVKALRQLPATPLLNRFATVCRTLAPTLHEALSEALPQAVANTPSTPTSLSSRGGLTSEVEADSNVRPLAIGGQG